MDEIVRLIQLGACALINCHQLFGAIAVHRNTPNSQAAFDRKRTSYKSLLSRRSGPLQGNAGPGLGYLLEPSLNQGSYRAQYVVVVFAEKPTEIFRDQVVLKSVALPDY